MTCGLSAIFAETSQLAALKKQNDWMQATGDVRECQLATVLPKSIERISTYISHGNCLNY
jgi:hypothetical protein